jgi:predicted lipoprotein with Yx(FWY)xxD motif
MTLGLALAAAFVVASCSANPSSTDTSPSTSASAALTGAARIQRVRSPYGDVLGAQDGRVLYRWTNESDGKVKCTDDACVAKWPPMLADGGTFTVDPSLGALPVTVVSRPDGKQQVAIGGQPVYVMAIDQPGEANCQGADGWYLLNLDGTTNAATSPTSSRP